MSYEKRGTDDSMHEILAQPIESSLAPATDVKNSAEATIDKGKAATVGRSLPASGTSKLDRRR